MHEDSPFAQLKNETKPVVPGIVHVLFCDVCHYVWKAPAETKTCINCNGNGETVRSLTQYERDIPLT